MSVITSKWDASEYLGTPEDIVAYLNAAIEENDPALLQAALGDVAKAQGMDQIARAAGVGRESLYKSLRADAAPS
ncbi:MAG: putative addiction module antidote protein [Propionibacteriaceae bacterium]|nr:putative addiction module antidote protein [Propionibacteriaceae bacterium]